MKLETLARGRPHGVVAVLIRETIEGKVKLRRNEATGTAGSQHHLVVFFLTFDPIFSVVLLIGSVELHELNCIFGEIIQFILEFRRDRFPQEITAVLDALNFRGWFIDRERRGRSHDHRNFFRCGGCPQVKRSGF